MSNSIEMAPLANTSETTLATSRRASKELGSGVDDGLTSPEDGVGHRMLPEPRYDTPRGEGEYLPVPTGPNPPTKPKGRPLDVNLYATKKTVAQGMMDLALLTANANQLRYVLESGNNNGPYYYFSVALISLSIILQLVVGVALIFVGRYNVTQEVHAQKADRLNNWVILGVFLITIINVFFSAFGIEITADEPGVKEL